MTENQKDLLYPIFGTAIALILLPPVLKGFEWWFKLFF